MSNLYCPKCYMELIETYETKDYIRYLLCEKCDTEYIQYFAKIGNPIEIKENK